jgi:hypothetical protein
MMKAECSVQSTLSLTTKINLNIDDDNHSESRINLNFKMIFFLISKL